MPIRKTRSEILFEHFLKTNGIAFEPVPVAQERTPDYCVNVDAQKIIFEVKEIVGERPWNFGEVHSGIVGDAIRAKIADSKGQIRIAAQQGMPTVLLIFNNYDPIQLFGTEDHDFEQAMLGAHTLLIDKKAAKSLIAFTVRARPYRPRKTPPLARWAALKRGKMK